jgi:tetratricopeptide (TPR) repeat protein
MPYTVCEYVSGGDLHQALRQSGEPFPLDQAIAITQDICRALVQTHSRAILHRDIKPGNIWLTDDGTAKLGDFGLAAVLEHSRITQLGTVLGTAAYMSPEQALGGEVTSRSDLYSLGCVLYEMVTGRPPFLGDDVIAVVSQHINTAPVAASWHRADLPRALDALIERLLAKAPQDRPASAAAVLDALAAVAAAPLGAVAVVPADANSLERLAGGVFVGREGETEDLRGGLDGAMSGLGRLVLVAGEPGIGKTRLAEELATYASVRGAQVLWGRCYEGEGAPAYWPWVQAIRAYVHGRDAEALRSELGTGAADIAQVVSEVRERLPDLPTPASMEPEQARFRLFDSITTFLKNAANAQPLVLILDDLHWADKPSLLLLQFVARGLGGARLLLVATYRDVEVRRQHPLSSTLAELAREQLSQRVVLRGLSEDEVARFIEMSCGVAPPEGLVAAVHKDTEGNPFFVKEVVNLLAREGRLDKMTSTTSWTVAIPQSVREVVGRRLDGLSEECNRVLTIASVIGREFDLRTLEQITGLPGDTVLDLLEESVAARIVDELPAALGRYSFSHALIRETLYEELTVARRARLHRQIGDVLEQTYASRIEPHVAELAYHFFQAAPGGDVEKAFDYATRAGDQAMKQYAWEEAAQNYERALQALELGATSDEAQRCELLLWLGEAEWSGGNYDRSREVCYQAGLVAKAAGNDGQLARAAINFGGQSSAARAFGVGLTDERLLVLLETALSRLGTEQTALRAQVMSRLASSLRFVAGQDERREALAREAIAIAQAAGDPEALCYVLNATHWALWGPDNTDERLAMAVEAKRLASEQGLKAMLLDASAVELGVWVERGDTARVRRRLEEYTKFAQDLRVSYDLWFAEINWAALALHEGRFEEAEQLAQQALSVGRSSENTNASALFGLQMFALRREQGGLEEMAAGVRQFVGQYPAIPAWRCGLAMICAETGQMEQARAEFEPLAARGFADIPRDMFWLVAMFALSETCTLLRDAARAAILYDLLLPYRDLYVGAQAASFGSVWTLLGKLATTAGRFEDAAGHFEQALAANRRAESPPAIAHSQHDYAVMLLRRDAPGDREKALELVAAALDTARELGMKALEERALALQQRA